MATCPALSTGDAFLSTLLHHIDCQSQTLGAAGYQALANPSAPLSMALTGLLTIFIALFGLRMVLGETPSLRDGIVAIAKIGVVLVIATSWPAYRTVFYDLIVTGPAQISSAIGGPAGLPGTSGDLISRLQASDVAISRLITLGTGRNDLTSSLPADASGAGDAATRTPIADDPAFGAAHILFLSATVAGFAIVRLTAGVLLALGPLFAGLLLFDMARGLFVGWVRALAFTLLASIAATILFGVELALLEPWLSQVLQLRFARVITASAPIELLVICLAFALTLAGAFAVLLRLAFTTSLSLGRAAISVNLPPREQSTVRSETVRTSEAERSSPRALAIAGALTAAERRERGTTMSIGVLGGRASSRTIVDSVDGFSIPAFSQAVRRARPRKSIGAKLRDRRT